jgi:hypothetical protein
VPSTFRRIQRAPGASPGRCLHPYQVRVPPQGGFRGHLRLPRGFFSGCVHPVGDGFRSGWSSGWSQHLHCIELGVRPEGIRSSSSADTARLAEAIPGRDSTIGKNKLTPEQALAILNAKGDSKMDAAAQRKHGPSPGAAAVHPAE